MNKNKFKNIDLIIVNFYPFQETVIKNKNKNSIIENIDIGGPTLIRGAAKNYENVTVLTDPNQYNSFLEIVDKKHEDVSTKQLIIEEEK